VQVDNLGVENLILMIKSQAVLHTFVSAFAGVISFILAEDDKTFKSFFSEIFLALFSGLFIAAPLANYMGLGEQLTIATVAVSAVTSRRLILFIKSNYGDILTRLLKK
jgi:hypothetical protein